MHYPINHNAHEMGGHGFKWMGRTRDLIKNTFSLALGQGATRAGMRTWRGHIYMEWKPDVNWKLYDKLTRLCPFSNTIWLSSFLILLTLFEVSWVLGRRGIFFTNIQKLKSMKSHKWFLLMIMIFCDMREEILHVWFFKIIFVQNCNLIWENINL